MKHPFVIILDDATFLSRLDSADDKTYMTILKDSIAPESKIAESKSQESKIVESKIAESKIMESNIAILKNTLKSLINDKVNFALLDGSKRKTIKESYAKLWYYLELGKNEAIESYLRNDLQVSPNHYKLENLTSQAYIATKLKKSKELDNEDENFEAIEGNSKGKILFSRDFLIQLKRIAEYNYSVYMRKEESQEDETEEDRIIPKEAEIAGNLIYDEEFIPTTLDIKD